jgi:hypothetical protein
MSQNKNVWVSHPIFPEVTDRLKLYVDLIIETRQTAAKVEHLARAGG